MIIISRKYGRLANRLFLFAHFIAFSEREKIRVVNLAFDEYCEFFEGTSKRLVASLPSANKSFFSQNVLNFLTRIMYLSSVILVRIVKRLEINNSFVRIITTEDKARLDPAEWKMEFAKSRIAFVDGWLFRDNKDFNELRNLIVEYFRPVRERFDNIEAFVKKTRSGCDCLIGVHIRREDYRTWEGGKYYFEDLEYRNFMKQIKEILRSKKVKFLLCSDQAIDIDFFAKGGLLVERGTGHFVEDLYSLAECDYLLGPPSTYTMWASF